jgi:hypothetical protein
MKLLCFQAKRFCWKTHSKTLAEVPDQEIEQEVAETVVVFLHAEFSDVPRAKAGRQTSSMSMAANKRELKCRAHSFTHLGGATAEPALPNLSSAR